LEIEQTRFQDRLTVVFAVDEESLDARVPNLILQPLSKTQSGRDHNALPTQEISLVETKRQSGFVELSIKDDGIGLMGEAVASNGIGLSNTRERLQRLYGDEQQF